MDPFDYFMIVYFYTSFGLAVIILIVAVFSGYLDHKYEIYEEEDENAT